MRSIVTLLVMLCGFGVSAQTDDGLLAAKMLPLDTTLTGAAAYNDELLKCVPGYSFKFLDKQTARELTYLYEHSNHETLKIEYTYRNREADSSGKAKPLIFSQRIIADAPSITMIYNCMFGEKVEEAHLQAYSGSGLPFTYLEKAFHYSLLPDDYKPGYWVLLFTE